MRQGGTSLAPPVFTTGGAQIGEMAEDSKLVPPFAKRRSPICESSAVRLRTQNPTHKSATFS